MKRTCLHKNTNAFESKIGISQNFEMRVQSDNLKTNCFWLILKKTFVVAFLLLSFSIVFYSCDLTKQETRTGCWKLVDTETWWVEPIDGNPPFEQIAAIPFNVTYTRSIVNSGTTTYFKTVYSGAEYDLTRTDMAGDGTIQGTINYTWSKFPNYIDPGIDFACNVESKGNSGNGIGVSTYATEIGGWPGGYGVWIQSFRDGKKTANLTIDAPSDKTVSSKMKFIIELSSGGYFYISYFYIYEWIPE